MPSYTVESKVVAISYAVQVGVLEYRTDLLREYGYDHPPKTWDELESMAERLQGRARQRQERFLGLRLAGSSRRRRGRIIEKNRTISVNNSAAIRAWQRAKRWIGWISPQSVAAYRGIDSMNVLD